ncbi:pullulanase-associated domain-containing protein [Teretinema zuelzerae]|nr:pullulanase-associated domain-containing protein [Teretinema zuelzerae]
MSYRLRMRLFGLAAALLFSSGFIACSGGSTAADPDAPAYDLPAVSSEVASGYLRVNFKPTVAGSGFTVWAWEDFDAAVIGACKTWPKGIPFTNSNGDFICVDLKLAESPALLGMIVIGPSGSKATGNSDVKLNFPQKYDEIYLKQGSGTIYVNSAMTQVAAGLVSATITGTSEITLDISGSLAATAENLIVTDGDGGVLSIASISGKKIDLGGVDFKTTRNPPYTVSLKDGEYTDTVTAVLDGSLLDSWFDAGAVADLGLTLAGTSGTFKVWAPLAGDVSLLMWGETTEFDPGSAAAVAMEFDGATGVWTAASVDVSGKVWYQYAISNGAETAYVCDLYARAASPDSVAARITDISSDPETMPAGWSASYRNPFGANGTEAKPYTEAVIYEMHIRDWSRAFVSDSTGKFRDITAALNETGGKFYEHLRDLGITHVQILPSFDYAETNSNTAYNWGYNPYHYDVPEGRYVDYEGTNDGRKAVLQMREMVQAFHDAGIAVNLDVVYNHTSGTQKGSLFDQTVPGYYYRMTSTGSYSNGSGCGNETASNTRMFKKYMIESLLHWMNEYHMNGFRFDLMGLHESSTMKEIYEALSAVDPNVMVYGEPWTGGTSAVVNGATKATIDNSSASALVNGVACFNDDYRNAIKGAEFGGFKKGHVQGTFSDAAIISGLSGSLKTDSYAGGFTAKIGRSINYVECHDNYTLADKLAISLAGGISQSAWKPYASFTAAQQDELRAQNKLAAAYVFLAKGTPFINGGQEFLRTKKGDENSYSSPDAINEIDLSLKSTYSDVYKVYKGLIALRKSAGSSFMGETAASASTVNSVSGFTRYETGDYLVFFNATAAAQTLPGDAASCTALVSVDTGVPVETADIPVSIPPKSFLVLKK